MSLLRATAARIRGRRWLILSPVALVWLLLALLLGVAIIGMFGGGGAQFAKMQAQARAGQLVTSGAGAGGGGTEWDAGNIFSDQVFYNAAVYPDERGVQGALDAVSSGCLVNSCLVRDTYRIEGLSSPWCAPVPAETEPRPYAHMLFVLAKACGLNPQVAITMIIKESQGFTRPSPPAALTGFGCPDTGPGGSANCDSGVAGVWAQTAGLFASAARGRQDAGLVARYIEGQTHDILWNVAESGCGSAPVAVRTRATAYLYAYTPYQPNPAAIAAYPGEGDSCSSYGNRNIFFLFQKYFGPTGGGKPIPGAINANVAVNGVAVTLPANEYVAAAVRGKVIQAPSAEMAKGIAAGFGALGLPYVWGGGGDGAGPNDGCSRGGGDYNSCKGLTGFDCSGLTAYVYVQGGLPSPGGNSGTQRGGGQSVPYAQGLPGDIVGFPGHVAIYLGQIDGLPYILEASWVGTPVHVVPLTRVDRDPVLHRYWSGTGA
jgi:cell wall-associated NlpC family hydrolase